jgi:hypothetical protein
MRRTVYIVAAVFMLTLPSSVGRSQSTDRSEMDQWLRASEYQGDLPIGTKITMSNWQHKQFMPLGLICPGSCWLSRAALWFLLWRVWSGSRRPIVGLPGRRLNRGRLPIAILWSQWAAACWRHCESSTPATVQCQLLW